MMRLALLDRACGATLLFFALLPSSPAHAEEAVSTTTPIEHLIVVMQQNQTFDAYFGTYPGVDGLPPDVCLPRHSGDDTSPCVRPFHADRRPDLHHGQSTFWRQYNEGRMDGFVSALEARGQSGEMALAYYDDRELPFYWNLADRFVLFDRFFSSAHSGSVQNRMFSVAAVPGSDRGRIPAEGYVGIPTIFDRLEARGIEWKFYIRNYDPELTFRNLGDTGMLEPQIQWVPLLSMPRFVDDPELFARIVDLEEYFVDLERGTLPAVAYVLALGATEHPPANPATGQRVVRSMVQELMRSEHWPRSAFLLTYDDWGGAYDHVPPPRVDDHGYGFRVPALLVSPYAKPGFVDHSELDFTSILKFIEENWVVETLAERDARADSLATAFDFTVPPRQPEFIPWERPAATRRSEPRRGVLYLVYGAALILANAVIGGAARSRRSTDRKETS